MGISGLLPVLKSITRHEHVSKYCGKKVAIDGYSWLHKGAYGCATDLAEGVDTDKSAALLSFCILLYSLAHQKPLGRNRGEASAGCRSVLMRCRYVTYCMQRVVMLCECGVSPLVVFDGGRLPMKLEEESQRARRVPCLQWLLDKASKRLSAAPQAPCCRSSRRENLSKARACAASGNHSAALEFYQRSTDISPAVARRFIQVQRQSDSLSPSATTSLQHDSFLLFLPGSQGSGHRVRGGSVRG